MTETTDDKGREYSVARGANTRCSTMRCSTTLKRIIVTPGKRLSSSSTPKRAEPGSS